MQTRLPVDLNPLGLIWALQTQDYRCLCFQHWSHQFKSLFQECSWPGWKWLLHTSQLHWLLRLHTLCLHRGLFLLGNCKGLNMCLVAMFLSGHCLSNVSRRRSCWYDQSHPKIVHVGLELYQPKMCSQAWSTCLEEGSSIQHMIPWQCYFWCSCLFLAVNAPSWVSCLGSSLVRLLYPAEDGKSTLSLISSSAVLVSSVIKGFLIGRILTVDTTSTYHTDDVM